MNPSENKTKKLLKGKKNRNQTDRQTDRKAERNKSHRSKKYDRSQDVKKNTTTTTTTTNIQKGTLVKFDKGWETQFSSSSLVGRKKKGEEVK